MHTSVPISKVEVWTANVPDPSIVVGGLVAIIETSKKDLSKIFLSWKGIHIAWHGDVRLSTLEYS